MKQICSAAQRCSAAEADICSEYHSQGMVHRMKKRSAATAAILTVTLSREGGNGFAVTKCNRLLRFSNPDRLDQHHTSSHLRFHKCICRRPKQRRILGCKRPSSFSTLRYALDEDAASSLYIDTSCYSGVYLEQGTAYLRDCNVSHNALTGISAVSADNAVLDVRNTDLVSNETMQLEMPPDGSRSYRRSIRRDNRIVQDGSARTRSGLVPPQSQYHLQERR